MIESDESETHRTLLFSDEFAVLNISNRIEIKMESRKNDELRSAMVELDDVSSTFVHPRNIDRISLLKKRYEHQIGLQNKGLNEKYFPLKITCCGGHGFQTKLNVRPSDTIGNVKFDLWDKHAIPPCQQRLFNESSELEDDQTLKDYSIREGRTLTMIIHLLGYNTTPVDQFDVKLTYQQLGHSFLELLELSTVKFKFQPNINGIEKLKQRIEAEISAMRMKIQRLTSIQSDAKPISNKGCCGAK